MVFSVAPDETYEVMFVITFRIKIPSLKRVVKLPNRHSLQILNFSVERHQTKGKVIFIVPDGIIHESPCEGNYPLACQCSLIFINFN